MPLPLIQARGDTVHKGQGVVGAYVRAVPQSWGLSLAGSRVSEYPIPREFMVPSLDSSRNGRKVKR